MYLIKQIGNTMRMMIITRVLTDKNFISLFFPNVKTLTVFVVPLKCTSVKVVTVAPFVHLAQKRRKVITVKFIRMKSGNNKKNMRSEEHTSELQSRFDPVCRLMLEKKQHRTIHHIRTRTPIALLAKTEIAVWHIE